LEMRVGDAAPAKMVLCGPEGSPEYTMNTGEIFKGVPSEFEGYKSKSFRVGDYAYHFKLQETPLLFQLSTVLSTERPRTVSEAQTEVLRNTLLGRMIWVVLALAIFVNIFRNAFLSRFAPFTYFLLLLLLLLLFGLILTNVTIPE